MKYLYMYVKLVIYRFKRYVELHRHTLDSRYKTSKGREIYSASSFKKVKIYFYVKGGRSEIDKKFLK